MWTSIEELSRIALSIKSASDLNESAGARRRAVSAHRDKVHAWRHRVLQKKACGLHSRMHGANHSLAVLDEFGFVVAWYDRERSTDSDEVLKRHVSQFYISSDIASDAPTRHLKTALLNGRCARRGWRLRHDGVAYWGITMITPILLADGRLQGFAHLTQEAAVDSPAHF